jgi:transcriptional regulator with XRE-family HTH domain
MAQDNGPMPRKARPHPKPSRKRTFIREWRKKREVTLEKLSDMLMIQLDMELSHGQLSRIERGESPYTQDTLEAIAGVLDVTTSHLLNIDPNRPHQQPLAEFLNLSPDQQRQALALVRALDEEKTGTGG